jgi:hypothetical protein
MSRDPATQPDSGVSTIAELSVSEALTLRPADSTLVAVKGYAVQLSNALGLPKEARRLWPWPVFAIADHRYPRQRDMLTVIAEGKSRLDSTIEVGDFIRVVGRVVGEVGGAKSSNAGQPLLAYQEHAPAIALPRPNPEPTYDDGSWSVDDLFLRSDIAPGMGVAVIATLTQVWHCPDCPKNKECKGCEMPNHVLLNDPTNSTEDGLAVTQMPMNETDRRGRHAEVGKRYRFEGTFEDGSSDTMSRRGGHLRYLRHVLVPPQTEAKRK